MWAAVGVLLTVCLQFEIRFAPALAKKPTADKGNQPKDTTDPFAPPYIPELFVTEDRVKEIEADAGEEYAVLVRRGGTIDGGRQDADQLFNAAQQVLRDAATLPSCHEGVRPAGEPAHPEPAPRGVLDPAAARRPGKVPRIFQLRA